MFHLFFRMKASHLHSFLRFSRRYGSTTNTFLGAYQSKGDGIVQRGWPNLTSMFPHHVKLLAQNAIPITKLHS